MMLKLLLSMLCWLLSVIGMQFVLLFLKVLIWDLHSLTKADMWISLILSVLAIECLARLQKDGDT